jgi:hypothetical protein
MAEREDIIRNKSHKANRTSRDYFVTTVAERLKTRQKQNG